MAKEPIDPRKVLEVEAELRRLLQFLEEAIPAGTAPKPVRLREVRSRSKA